MRLSQLLQQAGLTPAELSGDADVSDVAIDSRACRAGSCFVAVRGWARDGHEFIEAAIEGGAAAVACEDPSRVPEGVPHAIVADSRSACGKLAQAILGWPSRKLTCVGITGTNGKTTVAHLVRAILEGAGHRVGLLGTIRYDTGARVRPAGTTTPDPVSLAELCDEMVRTGRTHLVMEASSHALHQDRTAGVGFDVGVFTNLSGDHLDYHETMENYLGAKRLLFERLSPRAAAVINRDDPAGEAIAQATPAEISWYGLNPLSQVRGRVHGMDATGSKLDLVTPLGEVRVVTPLIGRHNVYNALAASGASLALGVGLETIADSLANVSCVAGRLERVHNDAGFDVFVDYAHTDDALRNVLRSLRPVTRGRLIVVFGCGGDRDRTKRPRMAQVAEDLADRLVITSDNPRSEDPRVIIGEIVGGLDSDGRTRSDVLVDRGQAIAHAVAMAEDGDVVLIAGKGHETYQVVGDEWSDFDDVAVASEALQQREERA